MSKESSSKSAEITSASSKLPTAPRRRRELSGLLEFFRGYFFFILKNVIGWIFILGALPVGLAVPGPGGIPLFLIGFALVTFPGKRRLTSRVMRGKPIDLQAHLFTFLTAAFSIAATIIVLWVVSAYMDKILASLRLKPTMDQWRVWLENYINLALVGAAVTAMVVTWVVMRLSLEVANWIVMRMPIIRRRIRPWLRKHGFHFLPPRRVRSDVAGATAVMGADEILLIHERHHHRVLYWWTVLKPWLKRAVAVAITAGIFYWIFDPIEDQWPQVQQLAWKVSIVRLGVASGMFALFLFVFRALVWRRILQDFGHRLPVAAATRIWSTSELARYIPGVIWQVVGRVYLTRPYGVRGSVCSVSQILELAIFLLANILVAVACLLYFGIKKIEGPAQYWLWAAMALVPVLLLLLQPRVFHTIIDRVLRRLKKSLIKERLSRWELLGLLLWNITGLLWQSLAVFLIISGPLQLKIDWWWMVAGAYCLAWTAGFLAVWAPAGIGVREIVFVGAMRVALPDSVLLSFEQPGVLVGFLAFLSLLLRVWATAGELLLAVVAYALDLRGALNYPDAPGRVPAGTVRIVEPSRS